MHCPVLSVRQSLTPYLAPKPQIKVIPHFQACLAETSDMRREVYHFWQDRHDLTKECYILGSITCPSRTRVTKINTKSPLRIFRADSNLDRHALLPFRDFGPGFKGAGEGSKDVGASLPGPQHGPGGQMAFSSRLVPMKLQPNYPTRIVTMLHV